MRNARQVRRLAAAGLAVVSVGVAPGCEPVCDEPYQSVAYQQFFLGTTPTTPWPVGGTMRPPVHPVLDTDGDGAADGSEMLDDGHRVVIHRAADDLELLVPEPGYVVAGDPYNIAVGDLDGDGRSEALLNVYGLDVPHPQGRVPYVVPGTTASGTHDLVDVATTPFPGSWQLGMVSVGDVDADGHDDMASPRAQDGPNLPPEGWEIWRGGDVTTPDQDAELFVAGELQSVLSLGDRTALTLITDWPSDPGETDFEVTLWVPEGSIRFTSAGASVNTAVPIYSHAEIYDDGDQLWFTVVSEYRSVVNRWAWDLDTLCPAPD